MNQETLSKYDSEFCGKLPIHLINMIQSYGALLVVDMNNDLVLQVSENVQQVFNKPAIDLVGSNINDYLPEGFRMNSLQEKVPASVSLCDVKYLVILHHYAEYYLVEINLESKEEALEDGYFDLYVELRQSMNSIEAAKDIRSTAEIAARELKTASGFDKVMIYRFDTDWNGHVLAEEKEVDMESYINFTFPASDIPKQARDLYLKNPYRFIPDRSYQPVKLYPVINPATSAFVDLSDCNVRGVSAVHIEYLKNMNITASMSTRILKNGLLWGLIACHHKTSKQVNYKMCAMFEILSGIISTKITALEHFEMQDLNASKVVIYTSLLEEIYRTSDIRNALFRDEKNILDLFGVTGAVLTDDGNIYSKGNVPEQHDLEDLLLWIETKRLNSVFYTDSLSAIYDYALNYRDIGSGLLVIPINMEADGYLLLFRPEIVREINWGGDPETRLNFEADMKTYHPRFSFKLWKENVTGISVPWKPEEIATAEKTFNFLRDFTNNDNPVKRKA